MKELRELTPDDIRAMDYNTLISLVRETNRPPGGYKTIASVIHNTFLGESDTVLEIGTSTGVTAIEIAKLCGSEVKAIDINEASLEEARRRADLEGVGDKICFRQADAQDLDYASETFDLVFCGNVTSLIPDKEKARSEYTRVLKPDGFLAAVPMYYLEDPSAELLSKVSRAIQADVQVLHREDWMSFYNKSGLVLKFVENYRFDYIPDTEWMAFADTILARPFLQELPAETYQVLQERYREYIHLFRDNLSHMGYSILLYKKEPVNTEPELFRGSLITDGS